MGISQNKKKRKYFRIYEQIVDDPTAYIQKIAKNTGLSRDTISKYLGEMYEHDIMRGPSLSMKSASNYKEYVYFMSFVDPVAVFEGLKTFPHVVYHAMTSVSWNTMIVTDKPLDFSQLVGFRTMNYHGIKQTVYTPRVNYTTWKEGVRKSFDVIDEYTPTIGYKNRWQAPRLLWGSDEWKLFHAFRDNMRSPVTPTLREIGVRYDVYRKWQEDLGEHCTIHTEFYPEGYQKYMHYQFLFTSDHEEVIRSIFSLFPVTSVFTESGDQLLVSAHVPSTDRIIALICHIYDMGAKQMIEQFDYVIVLNEYIHTGNR
jgi:hypothetical protein